MLRGVLFGICDPELTVDILNSERRECTGDCVVDKFPVERGVGNKAAVPHRDLAGSEIRIVKEEAPAVMADREPLIHWAGGEVGVSDDDVSGRPEGPLPSGDRSVLGRPDEE